MSETSDAAQTSLAAQGAGLAMQTVGSYYSARAQKMQMRLQAKMAELNARAAEDTARDILMQGQRAEQATRLQGARIKSTQRTAMAANGVDLSSETSVALQTSTEYLSELDANTITANALRAAWGQRMNAVNYRGQSTMLRAQAGAINPWMQAAGTLISSGAQMATSYATFKDMGAI